MGTLLAVDLGLKLGMAAFASEGRLLWHRSHNMGSRERLKRGAYHLVRECDDITTLVLEGDKTLGGWFEREAKRYGAKVVWVAPERWRELLIPSRRRGSGHEAKQEAFVIARRIMEIMGEPGQQQPLRHDAAEAILIGYWWLVESGSFTPPQGAPGAIDKL